jgi:hypothetical protein
MFRIHQWGSGSAEFWKPQGTTLFLRETPLSTGGSIKHSNWFTRFYVQRYIETDESMRAPIFYDSDNTGYYLNPAGTSQLSYVLANDWFRAQGSSGFYTQDYGSHWRTSLQSSYGTWEMYGYGRNGWFGVDIIDGSGYQNHYMHENGNGGLYIQNTGKWVFYYSRGNNCLGIGSSDTVGGYAARINDSLYVNSTMYAGGAVYGTIFYDSNDSGYYIDPNSGESNWQGLSRRGQAQIGLTGKTQWRRPNITSDQNYWTGIMGWGTEDFNSVMTWGSGFIDTWSSPANAPSGTSHWVGVQAHHYTNAYNSAYGWQMVGGPIGNLRFRQSWPNAGAWRTIPMHDVNDGSGGALYAGIYYDSNNTGYYADPNQTSRFARTATDLTYFGSDGNKGYAEGYGTWSSYFRKIAYIAFDWNANYNTPENHGLMSTDVNGSFTDSVSLNSFNDINLRLDANNNNSNSYVRIHDNSTGNGQNVAYIGRESDNAIAYFYNRVYGAIYYDHDGSWFLDANGTSRLNNVQPNTISMVGAGEIRRSDAPSTYTQFNTTAQWRVVITNNENFRVNASETWSRVVIRSAGDIVAFYSDERLKTKKGSIDNALQKILQLDGFYYTTNDLAKSVGYTEEGLQIGISAQQVQDVLPEVVTLAPFDSTYDDNGNLYSISGENYLTVKYEKMVPLIIEGIKDQQKIVNWNNTEVKKLKNIIEDQQKQIDELKEMIKSLMK